MEISFVSKSLRDMCQSNDAIEKHFGLKLGTSLKALIADLRVAQSLVDIPALKIQQKSTDYQSVLIGRGDSLRLDVKCNHTSPPLDPEGAIDWKSVFHIQIMSIENAIC